jgi:hypothetical protein
VINLLPRSRGARLAAALAAIVAGALVFGGLQLFVPSSPLSFANFASLAGLPVPLGQPVSYAAFLAVHPAGYTYQVRQVQLIPLPGFRTTRLLGAVFLRTMAPPFQAFGYPPQQQNGQTYPVHSLATYHARSGTPPFKPELVLMYGLRGNRPGEYAAAGIQVTYVVTGHTYTVSLYQGALLYYFRRHQTKAEHRQSMAAYDAWNNRVAVAIQKLAAAKGG